MSDYDLINIIQYLPKYDRMIISQVSKRLCELSKYSYRENFLNITKKIEDDNYLLILKNNNGKIIIKILYKIQIYI